MRRKLLLCGLLVAIIATAVGCRQSSGLPKVHVGRVFLPNFGWNEALVYKRIPFFPTGTIGKLPQKRKAVAQLQRDADFYGKHLAKGAKVWWALEPVAGAQGWQPVEGSAAGISYRSGEAVVYFLEESSLFVRDKTGNYLRFSAAGFEPDIEKGFAITADLESQRRMTVSYSTWDNSTKRKPQGLKLNAGAGEYALLERRNGKVTETYYADGQMPSDKAVRILSSRRFWSALPFYPWRSSQKKRVAATLGSREPELRKLRVDFQVPTGCEVEKKAGIGLLAGLTEYVNILGPQPVIYTHIYSDMEPTSVSIAVFSGSRSISMDDGLMIREGGGRRRRLHIAGKYPAVERQTAHEIKLVSRVGDDFLCVDYKAPKNLLNDYAFAYRDLVKSLKVQAVK